MGIEFACLVPHPPILIPEIGQSELSRVETTLHGMRLLAKEIVESRPEIIVVITPHGQLYRDAFGVYGRERFEGDFAAFGQPGLAFSTPGHPDLATLIQEASNQAGLPCTVPDEREPLPLDHGVLVPLYFLRDAGYEGPILPLTYSLLDNDAHKRFGAIVAEQIEKEGLRAALMASGDLSHRLIPGAPAGYSPRGEEFDQALVSLIRENQWIHLNEMAPDLVQDAGECGFRSLLILAGAVPALTFHSELISYEGPFGVGYGIATWKPRAKELDPAGYARQVLENYYFETPLAPPELPDQAFGCFVCLKRHGDLRGCIGTIMPVTERLEEEIRRNAVAAATEDPRFPPVSPDELKELTITVDILGPLEPVGSESELDPKRYGVVVRHKCRQGVLLPDLEGVDTVEQQLGIAMQKAGIPFDQAIEVSRFRVDRYPEI